MSSTEQPETPNESMTPEQIAALSAAVTTFGDAITDLSNRRRRTIIALCALTAFTVLLTVAIGVVVIHVRENAKTIKSVQCSLYSLVLSGGYHPEKHREDLQSYNQVYATIVHDNNRLGCVQAVDPTRHTTTTKGHT